MHRLSPNALGSLTMTVGSVMYVINDAFMRSITEDGPGPYQVLCMRAMIMASVFFAVGRARGEHFRRAHITKPLVARTISEIIATALFYAALVRIDFANAQSIMQIVPLLVTLGAVVLLRENVSVARYATILVGFAGVVVLVRPATDGFNAWALCAVLAALMVTVREFATRRIPADTPLLAISFSTAVALALLTAALSAPGGWEAFSGISWLRLGASATALSVGYVLSIFTVRVGDLSASAPFRYTPVVASVVIGYLAFGEVPDVLTWLGVAIILGSGLFAIHLERRAAAGRKRRLATS